MIRTIFPLTRTVFLLMASVCVVGSSACAADKDDQRPLRDLLAAETDRHVDRAAELAAVRNRGAAKVWWQSGFVAGDDQWLNYDEAVAATKRSEIRRLYEHERSAAGDSAEDQLRLASWCGRNGLPDRARAHLLVAMATDPRLQNERLLKRAGFERLLGSWMSKEQRGRLEAEVDRIDESLDHWRVRLLRIRRQLGGTLNSQRKALAELKEISDPKAIAAIDLVLGRSLSLDVVRVAIRTLAQLDCYEASQVLAKYAVFSDNPTVRREATGYLGGRRYEDFVPQMIELMATEIRATLTDTSYRPDAFLLNSEIAIYLKLERETDEQIQISYARWKLVARIVRTVSAKSLGIPLVGIPMADLRRDNTPTEKRLAFDAEFYAISRRVDEMNEVTTELNGRVSQVLSSLTGRDRTDDPGYWWKWWNRERDVETSPKTVVEVIEKDTAVEESFLLRMSCFAAGTPVWTETGLQPIESIQVGDRVLSKNVETSELAFRPVLKTTIRKAKPLVVVRSTDEDIKATGGHQFWQSGHGWVKARDLAALSRLHSVTGNVFVDAVQPGPTEQTFNLVVEDFHTYFVGKSGMLVQDLLLTPPTNMVVPGLTRFELQNRVTAK